MNRTEKFVLILIALSLAIGLWHGFPFTNVVADESYFSGAVLRAIDHHSILPLSLDVPYGTVTYYVNYVFISIELIILWVFKGFSLASLKLFVIQYPFVIYLVSRIVSFLFALVALFGVNNALRAYISDYRSRLALIAILFTNILVNVIFHTSKVWILSTLLMLASFYFLLKVIETEEYLKVRKYIWLSVITAFLAFANFPLMGVTLLCVPVIWYYKYYRSSNKEGIMRSICSSVIVGAIVALLIVLSNFSGIRDQVHSIIFDYTLSPNAIKTNASLFFSTFIHLKKVVMMFPLLVALIAYSLINFKIRHQKLFKLSLLYAALYILVLIFIDRWSVGDRASLRYFFPLPFFLAFIIASFDLPWKKLLWIPVAISVLYLIPTLYYLSVEPTNYKAVQFVRTDLSDATNTIIWNDVGADTELPQNKSAYLLTDKNECASKCEATIQYNLEKDFKPLVLDAHSDPAKIIAITKNAQVYFVERAASSASAASTSPNLQLIAAFTNPTADLEYYSADDSGNYFDLKYFELSRYGPNIYIYKAVR